MEGVIILIIIAAILIYFLPSIIHGSFVVFIVNLLFGWTLIGWLVALIIAVSNRNHEKLINAINEKKD